ncbi:MAG: phosphate transporter permease [Micrococcaceae bacterium]|jgi:teichoic acid transport system permease protein|nr:phosphate transporter permease [Micrococcaceae bacterium]
MVATNADEQEALAIQALSVDKRPLMRIGASPSFLDYLVQLWDYRHFSVFDARARIRSGNKRDKLGSSWLFLNPLMNGLTYYLIFGLLLNTSAGIENFIGFLIIGLFMFQFSSRAITNGARCIESNRGMVQAFKFPRATLALSINIRELLANIPPVLAMMLIIVIMPPTETISWLWILVIPAILMLAVFNLGVGLILARLIARISDVGNVLPFFLRAWMYASAIFFSYDRFIDHPWILELMKINPLFNTVDIIRDCLLYDRVPSWQSWAYLILVPLVVVSVGIVFFWRGEESYGRQH